MKNKICRYIKDPRAVSITLLLFAIVFNNNGFSQTDNSIMSVGADHDLDTISGKVSKFLFGPGVRKAALTLGLGAGLFQAFMSGSIRPLLVYGGLGLAVCYLPKVVDWISTIS